jgi:hypothetical protein
MIQQQKTVDNNFSMDDVNNRLRILSVQEISSYPRKYCQEIRYQVGEKNYYALGFKNNSGGYELRNKYFKGGSSPKDITLIENGAKNLAVFEGFFNFLSYLTLQGKQEVNLTNFLILNSASFFEKSLPRMSEYNRVHLYLDNDRTGQNCSQKALGIDREKFIDERKFYQKHKDLNDWLIYSRQSQKHSLTQRP